MSLTVIRPLSAKCSSTTSSFSTRCLCRMASACSSVVPTETVTRFSLVMTSEIGRSKRFSKRRSRLVRMPTRTPSLVTGTPEMRQRGGNRLVRANRNRVHDHAALAAFYAVHLLHLPVDRHVAMHNPDTALLCQRDRQVRFRHRIHGGGDNWHVESDLARQAGASIRFGRDHFAAGRFEKNVIESQTLREYVLDHKILSIIA